MPLQKRTSDGALLKFDSGPDMGKLMNECCCGVPAACPGGLANSYAIQGYNPTFFDPSTCVNLIACIGQPVWNGTFSRSGPFCQWPVQDPIVSDVCVNGFIMRTLQSQLYLIPSIQWNIDLTMATSVGPDELTTYVKTSGQTPSGIYTKSVGCMTGPLTLTIA